MEKVSLPIKTKIAAWWTIISGPILLFPDILPLLILIFIPFIRTVGYTFGPGVLTIAGALSFPFALFLLLTRKKWAWEFLFIVFFASTIFIISHYLNNIYFFYQKPHLLGILDFVFIFIAPLIFPITPFILLNLDKRNYFELIKEELTPILLTKTIAWIMMPVGVINIFFGIGMVFVPWGILSLFHWIIPMTLLGVLSFISGLFLLMKKRFGWWLIIFPLFIILYLNFTLKLPVPPFLEPAIPSPPILVRIFSSLPVIISLVLLLLDRKNFWKIAT